MRILITGSSGFIGSYLREQIPDAFDLCDSDGPIDLRDASRLQAFIANAKLDCVLHLAAQSHLPTALAHPEETFQINFMGTFHLLEALATSGFKGRFVFVSSADVYGADAKLPITEQSPTAPSNPYATSKRCAEELALSYMRRTLFEVVIARPFNQIGPRQSPSFALSSFAKQIAECEAGLRERIEVGNLDVFRDFLDVRDATLAYQHLLDSSLKQPIYNICSGGERSLNDALGELMKLSSCRAKVVQAMTRSRKSDRPHFFGSYELLHRETGWRPMIPMHSSLESLLNYWREKLCLEKSLP